MADAARIERLFSELNTCIDQMDDKLEFYRKFRNAYRELVQEMGLGHLWDEARQRGGWVALVGKAKRILYPDVPMFVPTPERPKAPKVKQDPERARQAEPYLGRAIEEMKRSVQELEQTYSSDPSTFLPGQEPADEIEQFLERKSIKMRSRLWRNF